MSEPDRGPARIISLDQFRGYTVAGMFLVNFGGHFQALPAILEHHNTYCSYADTIMPQFFFAAGFAFRLTFLRRIAAEGRRRAWAKAVKRSLGLILLGAVIYHLDGGVRTWSELQALGVRGFLTTAFQRDFFQTLVHIGVTAIWILPVLAAGRGARLAFAAGSAALHVLLSALFYHEWVMHRPGIDGGPLGFLTWTIPMLAGTIAHDLMTAGSPAPPGAAGGAPAGAVPVDRARALAVRGAVLMLLGYLLSCLNPPAGATGVIGFTLASPPFVPPAAPPGLWTMSQRAGSVSYLVFGAGFSFALYALFVLACDLGGARWSVFHTLGRNALAAYVIHDLVGEAVKPWAPADAPLAYALASFLLFFGITYLFVRFLEKSGIHLRL
jgi:predicted acyltransferase